MCAVYISYSILTLPFSDGLAGLLVSARANLSSACAFFPALPLLDFWRPTGWNLQPLVGRPFLSRMQGSGPSFLCQLVQQIKLYRSRYVSLQ